MLKLFLFALILAFAAASPAPAPVPAPAPAPEPKPGAILAAPAYTSGYIAPAVAYSAYSAYTPLTYSYGLPYYRSAYLL